MFEVPFVCEVSKLSGTELWTVVAHHLVWYAIAGKVTLEFKNVLLALVFACQSPNSCYSKRQ